MQTGAQDLRPAPVLKTSCSHEALSACSLKMEHLEETAEGGDDDCGGGAGGGATGCTYANAIWLAAARRSAAHAAPSGAAPAPPLPGRLPPPLGQA